MDELNSFCEFCEMFKNIFLNTSRLLLLDYTFGNVLVIQWLWCSVICHHFLLLTPNNMLKILIMKIKFCQGSTFHVVPKKQVKNLCWSKRQSKNFMHASTMCSLNKVQYSFDIIIGLNVLCKVPLSLFRTPAI